MLDQDDILVEDRSCAVCEQVYTRQEQRAATRWEPASAGWRCPACSGTRHRELRRQARVLIEQTDPPWRLVSEPSDADPMSLRLLARFCSRAAGLRGPRGSRCVGLCSDTSNAET